jgi:hypothetical protein
MAVPRNHFEVEVADNSMVVEEEVDIGLVDSHSTADGLVVDIGSVVSQGAEIGMAVRLQEEHRAKQEEEDIQDAPLEGGKGLEVRNTMGWTLMVSLKILQEIPLLVLLGIPSEVTTEREELWDTERV